MPTYEYRCEACGDTFERFQSITADPIRTCPTCEGPVRRLLGGGGGLIFKGSGFYQTDHRSKAYKAAEKADTQAPAPAEKTCSGNGACGGNGECVNKS